jgi:hypothetical protein
MLQCGAAEYTGSPIRTGGGLPPRTTPILLEVGATKRQRNTSVMQLVGINSKGTMRLSNESLRGGHLKK